MLYPLLLVCGAVLLFLYIREKIKAYSVKAVLLKSVVSMLFIMVGVYGSPLRKEAPVHFAHLWCSACYVVCWVISGWISNMYSLKKMRLSHTLAFAYSALGTSCISLEC